MHPGSPGPDWTAEREQALFDALYRILRGAERHEAKLEELVRRALPIDPHDVRETLERFLRTAQYEQPPPPTFALGIHRAIFLAEEWFRARERPADCQATTDD